MSLDAITARVHDAETAAGRARASTTLIAVSKIQPEARIRAVLDEGHRIFGENRVQEAAGKWPAFREEYSGVQLHLLGPLQSNKTRQAMELFDAIHTLDREKLADRIAMIRDELGHCPELFVQVNTGREPQKAGVDPDATEEFVTYCRNRNLPVIGLMCIPPADEDPVPHFDLLAKLARKSHLEKLSMGMSGDFEAAIAAGATHIRVGSAIFGERVYG